MCTHLCQTQETGGGQGGSRAQLYNYQNRTCFLFPTCVFFPQLRSNLQVTQKKEKKKPSPHQRWRARRCVCVWGGWGYFLFSFFLPPIQNKASCSLCLALFVCISSYSSGRPCMEGRKKDSSLTAFDVHVLWSHVSALSVKSFCCPSA